MYSLPKKNFYGSTNWGRKTVKSHNHKQIASHHIHRCVRSLWPFLSFRSSFQWLFIHLEIRIRSTYLILSIANRYFAKQFAYFKCQNYQHIISNISGQFFFDVYNISKPGQS